MDAIQTSSQREKENWRPKSIFTGKEKNFFKEMFIFYNFIVYDHDPTFSSDVFNERKVLYKSKKKMNPNISLFTAVTEVFESLVNKRKIS